mmetsp:Transcript_88031/g.228370  ORF Transcript_88031/g.228370 Transcript_88031/m.228370 type:complete len:1087 (+) Transcript_88031:91-3351(+)
MASLLKEMFPELFVETGVVAAEQVFHRKLTEYEMNIEQQKLWREDLRDLVELTVGRMDIYHLVGALLLEFCVSFYCENHMIEARESDMPPWVLTFFLLSNLSAAGYLIFAVWLSMHASVASHSIGVRLLTRFARLSIPSREELEDVAKANLVPLMDRLQAAFGGGAAGGGAAGRGAVAGGGAGGGAVGGGAAGGGAAGAAGEGNPENMLAIDQGASLHANKSLHFKRFLHEQRRWLCYDAFARVCMSLGINQMLAALSYYCIGVYIMVAPSAGFIMLCGIQLLSLLVLRLDMVPGDNPVKEVCSVIAVVPTPPLYVATLITLFNYLGISHMALAWIATPAFLLHACWPFILAWILVPPNNADISVLPKQLRTVLYLDVLHAEQDETEEAAREDNAQNCSLALQQLRENLEEEMRQVLEDERRNGSVSILARNTERLQVMETELRSKMEHAGDFEIGQPDAEIRAENRRTQRLLDRLAAWQSAPRMHASYEALWHRPAWDYLSEEQQTSLQRNRSAFLRLCLSLDLGIASGDAGGELGALPVTPGEELTVRVDAPNDLADGMLAHEPGSVYLRPNNPNQRLEYDRPPVPDSGITSFGGVLRQNLQFVQQGRELQQNRATFQLEGPHPDDRAMQPIPQAPNVQAGPGQPGAPAVLAVPAAPPRIARDEFVDGAFNMPQNQAAEPGPDLIAASATPPQALPGVIVRRFTIGMGVAWVAAGAVHFLECVMNGGKDIVPPTSSSQNVHVIWPEPAGLFQVSWLHCNSSHVLVNNRFSIFAAERLTNDRVAPFMDVMDAGKGNLMCDPSGCDLLSLDEKVGTWRMASLPTPLGSGRTPSELPLPPAWHHTAVVRVPCAAGMRAAGIVAATQAAGAGGEATLPLCETAAEVAGWDGQDIIVARSTAWRAPGGNLTWTVRSRFALRPGRSGSSGGSRSGRSAGGVKGAKGRATETTATATVEVVAMGFGPAGRTLTVLESGGVLEAWDLVSGRWLGRWDLPWDHDRVEAPHAMCHDGAGDVVLAHAPASPGDPPHLARWQLPVEIRHAEQEFDCNQAGEPTAAPTASAAKATPEAPAPSRVAELRAAPDKVIVT